MNRRDFLNHSAMVAAGGFALSACPAMGAATLDRSDLLNGLEGYPAQALTRAFQNLKKKFYIVNKASDLPGSQNEAGTLRFCIEAAKKSGQDEMSWIVFDPDVFAPQKEQPIELTDTLKPGSHTILDGRGAKVRIWSPGDIHLIVLEDVENVIVRNFILHKTAPFCRQKYEKGHLFPVSTRPGIDPSRPPKGVDRDGIALRGSSTNIWIDHCTFFLCGDESIGAMSGPDVETTQMTVSWCHFSDQYYVALLGHSTEDKKADEQIRLTFHHNWITNGARRNPRVNRATVDIYNNCLEGWTDWGMAANVNARVLIEGNIFEAKASKEAISIGVGDHINGYVKIKNNAALNGARLDSYLPENAAIPTYKRTVEEANDRLKEKLKRNCGWQI